MYCIQAYQVNWYILFYSPTFVDRVTVVIKIFPVNLSQTKFEVQINYVSKFNLLNRHWEPLIGKTPVPLANLVCNLLYNLYCMQVNYIQAWSTLYSWNPSIYNIICWVAWTMGQTNCQPSVWCSKYLFFSWFLAKFFAKILSIYFLISL